MLEGEAVMGGLELGDSLEGPEMLAGRWSG